MYDLDKDWIPVILAVVTPTVVGIGWYFKTKREDRLTKELERKQDKLRDLAEIERLNKVVFDMHQAQIADADNKRREVDVSNKLLLEMSGLLKASVVDKEDLVKALKRFLDEKEEGR